MTGVDTHTSTVSRRGWRAVWLPGLAVAVGAAVATAHGLFEVAVAARVPAGIAWIYPLITDGLALVAYAATARLSGSGARYAWSVVIVSAGLSGLAQASYLASDAAAAGGGLTVSPALRFGVGAWPAVAAAVVAHLLYLLAAERAAAPSEGAGTYGEPARAVPAEAVVPSSHGTALVGWDAVDTGAGVPAALDGPVIAGADPVSHGEAGEAGCGPDVAGAPARDHAQDIAERHRERHGALPTVRELQTLADVSRGTAARALTRLRDAEPEAENALHLVTDETDTRTQP